MQMHRKLGSRPQASKGSTELMRYETPLDKTGSTLQTQGWDDGQRKTDYLVAQCGKQSINRMHCRAAQRSSGTTLAPKNNCKTGFIHWVEFCVFSTCVCAVLPECTVRLTALLVESAGMRVSKWSVSFEKTSSWSMILTLFKSVLIRIHLYYVTDSSVVQESLLYDLSNSSIIDEMWQNTSIKMCLGGYCISFTSYFWSHFGAWCWFDKITPWSWFCF